MPTNRPTIQVVMTPELLRALDDWRRRQPEIPSRSKAIRMLIEAGLGAPTEPIGYRPPAKRKAKR